MTQPIVVHSASEADAHLWRLTKEITALFAGLPWVLIGGQMVAILEAEYGVVVGRATADVDALLDVRVVSTVARDAADLLRAAGFEPEPIGEGLAYRFRRGAGIVDILVPDHLGGRADLRTVPPGITLEALGGRQALNRSRRVQVDAGDGVFEMPIPSLIGAIVIKARVTEASQTGADKHRRDLARLLALVQDPTASRDELNKGERACLRARTELRSVDHPAWRGIAGADDGVLALSILGDS